MDATYWEDELISAVKKNDAVAARHAMAQGLDTATSGVHAAMVAVQCHRMKMVRLLLDLGVDPDASSGHILKIAVESNQLEIAMLLTDRGADAHRGEEKLLCSAANKGYMEIAKWLVDCGADIHAQDGAPLRWACMGGQNEAVVWLHGLGAKFHVEELLNAASLGHAATVKLLLELYPISVSDASAALDSLSFLAKGSEARDAKAMLAGIAGTNHAARAPFLRDAAKVAALPVEERLNALVTPSGKARPRLMRLAWSQTLAGIFVPEAWEGESHQARELYSALQKALPSDLAQTLREIDMLPFREDIPGFVDKVTGQKEKNLLGGVKR